jgi:hypothetical protein
MTRTRGTLGLATTTLVLAALVGASTPAVAAPTGAPPPRTSATVSDPVYDTTGTDPDRRSRADVLRVDYTMPLPRNRRLLQIDTTLRRVGINGFGYDAPLQQVKTLIDGPGGRDYAVTVYNSSRSPRVVSLAGDRPRQVAYSGAGWGFGAGRNESIELQISTEWLRGMDRASFTATGISRRATDRTRTAPRLNTRYAGVGRPGGMAGERDRPGTYADPTCSRTEDGDLRCSFGTV